MPRPQPTAAVAGVPQIDMSKLSPTTRAFIAKLQQKTQDAPGSAGRIAELGKYYYANGFPPAAAKCFERAAEILPNAMQFKYLAGLCYDTAGDSASAVQAYEAALALADDYPALHILVADRCLDDDRDRAEALYRRASVLDAKDALAHYGLGRCAVLNGDLEAAVSGFGRAVEIDPTFAAAHGALAEALRKLGREREAADHDDPAAAGAPAKVTNDPVRFDLQASPRSEVAFAKKALQTAHEGDPDLAVRNLERVIELGLDGAPVRAALGDIYIQQRRFEEAMVELQDALAKYPDSDWIKSSLGLAFVQLGFYGDAEKLLREQLDKQPDNVRIQHRYGILLSASGKRDEAMSVFARIIEGHPDDAGAHCQMGQMQMGQGKFDDAEQHFRKALASADGSVIAHYGLGSLLHRKGEVDAAVRHWRRAIAISPRYGDAHMALAVAALGRKQPAAAVEAFREGLKHIPDSAQLANGLAWTLATCRDPAVWDPANAVKWAEKANKASGGRVAQALDTLAAAYAAAGRYSEAADTQKRAVKLVTKAGQATAIEAYQARLALYESGRPFLEAE